VQIEISISGLPVEGTAYKSGEDVILHILGIARKTGEKTGLLTPFYVLFQPISSGFIEFGEWEGKAYKFEGGVELVLGPDGKVRAQVCNLAKLPSTELPTGTVGCPVCHGSGFAREEEEATGKIFTGRCPLCWGTCFILLFEPSREGKVVYALGFWNCKCVAGYIHPENHDHCLAFGAVVDNQPASRASEVQECLAKFGLTFPEHTNFEDGHLESDFEDRISGLDN
jgi:hypothetical protein